MLSWKNLIRVLAIVLPICRATAGMALEVSGVVLDGETREPLPYATVKLDGTSIGAMTDHLGSFRIPDISRGGYTLKVSYLGYQTETSTLTVDGANPFVRISLVPLVLRGKEVVVEVNRARERETPVAFTNVTTEKINQQINGQDAPLLVKGTPGVYAFSTDGVGNGEAKLFVRGFGQEYVQVLINGVPTNDPESNAVYWSNWGSVSSSAQSIQVQRGAGSSLYGAGSFGGSFNIVTQDPAGRPFYGLNLSTGDPRNDIYGITANTGLLNNRFSLSFKGSYKAADGERTGGIYKGGNYYLSTSWYIDPRQTLKAVAHGAPQEHTYSWSAGVDFFQKFGFKANPSPYLPREVVEALPASSNGLPGYGLLDGTREIVGKDYVGLSHNHFHKPQMELHYSFDRNERSAFRTTLFYTKGSGGGSSLNGTPSSSTVEAKRAADGVLRDEAYVRDTYLKNAYQRDSYSLHRQYGILSSLEHKLANGSRMTVGGEFRSWYASHPGFYTNLFGKPFITDRQYAYRKTDGTFASFRRKNFEGDLGHASDTGNPFDWDTGEASRIDPTYRAQYRNYEGWTPQFTLFGSGNWRLSDRLNATTSLQYVWYEYHIKENMPSESAIGTPVAAGTVSAEGPDGSGKFYMQDATTPAQYYQFTLVDQKRRRGFWQPKAGLNCNLTDRVHAFASFSHVERFVNLGVFYNFGIINPAAQDEKSNQFEAGIGYASGDLKAKLNAYRIVWSNKATSITDVSKAGQPGYDRNGNRTELIGTSHHRGVELELDAGLRRIIPVDGLNLTGSFTYMDNVWTHVQDQVKTNPDGTPRVFSSGLDASGKSKPVYFSDLEGTHVANQPQTALSVGLAYRHPRSLFLRVDVNYYTRDYSLDGEPYRVVDGAFDASGVFVPTKYSTRVPSRGVVDLAAGYRFQVNAWKMHLTAQMMNLFNKRYYSGSDRSGFLPGSLRTYRLNVTTGF